MIENKENYSFDQIVEDMINLKKDIDFQTLKDRYYTKSFPEILGVSRRENSHSNFLGWLLDHAESHHLGDYSIRKFLDIVLMYGRSKFEKSEEMYAALLSDNYEIEDFSIELEKSIDGGRLDIFIELTLKLLGENKKLQLVIENKVKSSENKTQTERYFNFFNKNNLENSLTLYIYLTALPTLQLSTLEEPECSSKEFIQINYQSLVDYLIEPALDQKISNQTKVILEEYLKSLSQPAISPEGDGNNKELIMAFSTAERELLSNFWEKNSKLILATLTAIRLDPEQDSETIQRIEEAVKKIGSKDFSKYSIEYNGKIFKEAFVKADIGFQTIQLLKKYELIDEHILSDLKSNRRCGIYLIKQLHEISDEEKNSRRYGSSPAFKLNEHEYYVARDWSASNANKFIVDMEKKFKGLKYKINGS